MNSVEQMFRKKYYAQLYEISSRLARPSRLFQETKWMEEIYLVLHSLKGTAGTIGFPHLSHMAETGLSMFSKKDEFILPVYMIGALQALVLEMIGELRSRDLSLVEESILVEMQKFNEEDGRRKRILIVDDDETLLASMHQILSAAGFEVEIISNPQVGLTEMLDRQPDCIVLDVMMPETTGFHILQQIRSDIQRQLTPVLFLTARTNIEDKYKGFQLGADEYLTKPFHFEELMLRIKTLITRVEKYRSLSQRDQLTGLYNRRYLMERLEELFASQARKPFPLSLAILDLDFFKKVNDTYGHPCGDTVLKTFARFLQDTLRETDIVTRYGGEEFVIILPDTEPDQALAVLNRVREKFSRIEIQSSEVQFFQTFSGGISELSEGIATIPLLIQEADKALYLAKYRGRNTICLSSEIDDTTQEQISKKVLIADDDFIIHAILQNQLKQTGWELHFAQNGSEVLSLVKEITPDMFILDGVMPDYSGLDLCDLLRKQPRFASTPILMLTGRNNENDIAEALDTGADDYIVKPFSPLELKARMNRLFIRTDSGRH